MTQRINESVILLRAIDNNENLTVLDTFKKPTEWQNVEEGNGCWVKYKDDIYSVREIIKEASLKNIKQLEEQYFDFKATDTILNKLLLQDLVILKKVILTAGGGYNAYGKKIDRIVRNIKK